MHSMLDNGKTLQLDVPRAFVPLLAPCRYKGASGGRAASKSHFFCEGVIEDCLRDHHRTACIREVQESLSDSVKQTLEDKIEIMGLQSSFHITTREIVGPNESLIVFKGAKAHTVHSLKSLEGFTRAYIEEAQALSQRSVDELIPTFRAAGSEMWFAWNPIDKTDPVEVFFEENKDDPDFTRIHVTYADNPWLPDESRRDMERMRRRDPEKYAHVWLGKYRTMSEARVFRNWTVEAFETPEDATFYFGADWGYSIDPTVLIRCFIKGRTLFVDEEVYRVGCEIDHCPFLFGGMKSKSLRKLNKQAFKSLKRRNEQWLGIPGARKWKITADNARPETISYMKKHGFPTIQASIKGPGSLAEGVEFLQNYDIVVHPRCKHTADELTFYSYKTDPRTDEVIPVLEDRKNHVIDSLRYAVEQVRRKSSWRPL